MKEGRWEAFARERLKEQGVEDGGFFWFVKKLRVTSRLTSYCVLRYNTYVNPWYSLSIFDASIECGPASLIDTQHHYSTKS